MSNYTKTTDFASKDALLTGNPSKLVKGTEINVEFSNIQTAVNSKLDSSGVTAFAATLLDDIDAATARGTLEAAKSGSNADITSMTGLSNGGIPLVKVSGAAASGANADITSLGAVASINGGALAGFRNRIINGNFGVNQRAYVSGAAVGAGLYGHDRWKMAASGDTYTFSTTANVTTVTIPAGKVLQQVIEGLNLETGTYTLSWSGTAQGKIGAGSYGSSGITGAITGGTNTTIEFGPGTVSRVQLEFGGVATVFEQRPYGMELALCGRYAQWVQVHTWGYATGAGEYEESNNPFRVEMRAVPSYGALGVDPSNTDGNANGNLNTQGFQSVSLHSITYRITPVGAGAYYSTGKRVFVTAEL